MKELKKNIQKDLASLSGQMSVDAQLWEVNMFDLQSQSNEEEYRIVTCHRKDDEYQIPVSSFYKPISNWFNIAND